MAQTEKRYAIFDQNDDSTLIQINDVQVWDNEVDAREAAEEAVNDGNAEASDLVIVQITPFEKVSGGKLKFEKTTVFC
jgi:hypothetical protein